MKTDEYQLYSADGSPTTVIIIGSPQQAIQHCREKGAERAHLYTTYDGNRRFRGYAFPDGRIAEAHSSTVV